MLQYWKHFSENTHKKTFNVFHFRVFDSVADLSAVDLLFTVGSSTVLLCPELVLFVYRGFRSLQL